MTDRVPVDLDRALRALAPSVEFPPVADLATEVSIRLGAPTAPRWRWRWARPVLLAASLTLLLVATAAALAWVLPGLRILPVASVPPAPTAALGTGLALGDPAGAPTVSVGALGTPNATFVNRDGDVTTLVYAPRPGLPAMSASRGIALLLQRVEGTLDRSMVMKLVDEVGARVVPVQVDGSDGFWIAGPPHLVRYVDAEGRERSEMTRLAGDSLVWQVGPTLYRMESALGLEAALDLAESVETGTSGP